MTLSHNNREATDLEHQRETFYALAIRLETLSKSIPVAHGAPPCTPARCSTQSGSWKHLVRLCRYYCTCQETIRHELEKLIVAGTSSIAADPSVLLNKIEAEVARLLQWDLVLEESFYVGPAAQYRHLGRGLGHVCCERLAHNCHRAARSQHVESGNLLHWIAPPAWFREVEAHYRRRARLGWIAGTSIVLLGTAWALFN